MSAACRSPRAAETKARRPPTPAQRPRHQARTLARTLLLALAGGVLVGGCGARHETVAPTSLAPLDLAQASPGPGEAPIYAAAGTGQFRQSGLRVTLLVPQRADQTLAAVADGQAQLGVTTEPALLEARDRGLALRSVAALVNAPLSAAIWLPGGRVSSLAGLAKVPVGTSGLDYERAFATALARSAGAAGGVSTRTLGPDLAGALTRHSVPAVIAYQDRDGAELRAERRRPVIAAVAGHGVPTYDELVIVARAGALARERDVVRSFIGALVRSTRALAHGDPASLAAAVAADTGIDPAATRIGLAMTLPLFEPPPGQPFGFQNPAQWEGFWSWMRSAGLIRGTTTARSAFTNAYLPGEGL